MYLTQTQANNKDLICYLAEQAISEGIQTITPLSGGITSHTYEVNHHLIFKLPGVRTLVERWHQQSQCAPILQKHLCVQIPHPELKKVFLSSSDSNSLLVSVSEKIQGHILSHSKKEFFQKDPLFKEMYFEQLAHFAHQLHSIDPSELPVQLPTTATLLENLISQANGGMTTQQKKIFKKIIHFAHFNSNSEKTVLCHCDLRAANVCLDEKNNIVGILDFDTLNRGKSFMEFRPNLYGFYKNELDTKQFCHSYYQQAGLPEPTEQLKKMRHAFTLLYVFGVLSKYQNRLMNKCHQLFSSFKKQKML